MRDVFARGDKRKWITGRPVPIDHGGPVDVPFAPIPAEWLDRPVWDYFELLAERDPDRLVVNDGTTRLTYRQLRNAAVHLANRVSALVGRDQIVAGLMTNDATFAVQLLSGFARGGAGVPIDISSPADRKAALLKESDAAAVVVWDAPDLDLSFVPDGVPVIRVDALCFDDVELKMVARDIDAPVSINFTSGSTGRPKGIVYSERQAMHLTARHIETNHINRDDVILGIASLSAAGLREALCALLSGALLRPLDVKKAGMLESMRVMREERVSVLSFVPSPMRMLMQLPGIELAFEHLRILDLVGEATTAEDIALFRAKLPPTCKVGLALGSTEAYILFHWFVDEAGIAGPNAPIGYLAAGRTVAVLDENDQPVPLGEVGELVVSDEVVALGYWRNGSLDPSRFAAAPGDPGPRTYRTGDLVRLRPDGLAEFAGRADRMVKVRGLQADLGEIEAALKSVPGVDDGVVVAQNRDGDSTALIAFAVPSPGATPAPATIRDAIAQQTAEHMVPHAVRFLDSLPRLHNGKPDLVRLAAMVDAAA